MTFLEELRQEAAKACQDKRYKELLAKGLADRQALDNLREIMLKAAKEGEFADMFWSYGKENVEQILRAGKMEQFMSWVEEMYPDGVDMTKLNDIMSFEPEEVFKELGM